VADTIDIMADEKRRRTIPIFGDQFAWWPEAVKRQLEKKGIDQKTLAKNISATEPEVTKCVRRKNPVYELLIAISDELDIPYPVILPESEAEALRLATERRLFRRDLQLAQIQAGVPERTVEDQTPKVPSEHVQRARKSSKKHLRERPRRSP
jgi:transcriptional regulator with XRE-family HTH domain